MGYTGSICGRAQTGTGPQGTILRVSGDVAAGAWVDATSQADNVSRLDIAATVQLDHDDWRYEARRWEEYATWRREHSADAAGLYVESANGGATTYIGSRSSEVYLRIYNKEAECKKSGTEEEKLRYQRCHRYELEVKNLRADAVVAALTAQPKQDVAVLGWIAGFCDSRGISTLDLTLDKLKLVPGFHRRTDTDVKLGWLATQVKPTLDWLMERGGRDAALRVLGLDQPGEISRPQTEAKRQQR